MTNLNRRSSQPTPPTSQDVIDLDEFKLAINSFKTQGLIEHNNEAIETELAQKLLIYANNDLGKVKGILETVRDKQGDAFASSMGIIVNSLICGYSALQTLSLSQEDHSSDNPSPNPSIAFYSAVMATTGLIAIWNDRSKAQAKEKITFIFRTIEGTSLENQGRSGQGR